MLPPGARVLDLCCGPGRFTVPMAARSFRTTGVDRSPFLLGKARDHAAAEGVEVEWEEADMRDFERPGHFDAVLDLFTSFGYFENEQDDLKVLSRIHASLAPGGLLLMELACKEYVGRVLEPLHAVDVGDGAVLVQRHRILDGWNRIWNEWTFVDGDRVERFTFAHNLYSGRELADRLRATGFDEVRLLGDLEGAPFDGEAKRLVVLARKPA